MNLEKLLDFYQTAEDDDLCPQKDSSHFLEFLTATRYLDTYLPPACKVLDSCAGIGLYSFYLAKKGHQVTACDIVPYNTRIIEKKQKETPLLNNVFYGDAMGLPQLDSASFDAVLCMGALSHLPEATERWRVINESIRLLVPEGILVCTYVNRHAVILQNLSENLNNIAEIMQFLDTGRDGVFYASTPDEMEELMSGAGISTLCHVALDGLSTFLHHVTSRISCEGLRRFHEYHFASCQTPSLLGYSYHNMFIGKAP